jgi:hypothetical protein
MDTERIPSGSEVHFEGEEQKIGCITFPGSKSFDGSYPVDIYVYPDGDVISGKPDQKSSEPQRIEGKLAEAARAFVDERRDKFSLWGIEKGNHPTKCSRVEVRTRGTDFQRASIWAKRKELVISVFQPSGEEKIIRIPLTE